jgi:putative SOS response-associated peptidase YedK
MTQLYKSKWFRDLTEDCRLKNIIGSLSEVQEKALEYCLDYIENPPIFMVIGSESPIEFTDYSHEEAVMVIQYQKDEKSLVDYIWEYYPNWIKIREFSNIRLKNNGKV